MSSSFFSSVMVSNCTLVCWDLMQSAFTFSHISCLFPLTHSEFQVYVLSVCVWLENQTQNLCALPNAQPGTFIRRVTGICQYSWCKRQLNLHHFTCHLKKCLVCFRWTFTFWLICSIHISCQNVSAFPRKIHKRRKLVSLTTQCLIWF